MRKRSTIFVRSFTFDFDSSSGNFPCSHHDLHSRYIKHYQWCWLYSKSSSFRFVPSSLALCTNLFLYSFFPLPSENLNKVTEQRIKMMIDSIEAFISLFLLLFFIFSRVKSFLTKNGMCWLIIKLNVSFLKYVINCMYIQCILCGMKTAHSHIHSTDMLLSRVNLIRMNNSLLFE